MKKPPDLKHWTRSWSEFCSWSILCDTHSITWSWDQPLVFAHSPEDILSSRVFCLLGLSISCQPWKLLLSANQHLLMYHYYYFGLPFQVQLPLQSTLGLPWFLVCHVGVSQGWVCLNAWLLAASGYGNSTWLCCPMWSHIPSLRKISCLSLPSAVMICECHHVG